MNSDNNSTVLGNAHKNVTGLINDPLMGFDPPPPPKGLISVKTNSNNNSTGFVNEGKNKNKTKKDTGFDQTLHPKGSGLMTISSSS